MDETTTSGTERRPRVQGGGASAAASPRGTRRPARRLAREEKTIAAMVGMYCRDHHGTAGKPDAHGGLCDDCAALLTYARRRLERCPYGVEKPTCAKCTTHCYKPAMREQVRVVMRYAGPRMMREHPLLAAAHLTDGRRKTPSED